MWQLFAAPATPLSPSRVSAETLRSQLPLLSNAEENTFSTCLGGSLSDEMMAVEALGEVQIPPLTGGSLFLPGSCSQPSPSPRAGLPTKLKGPRSLLEARGAWGPVRMRLPARDCLTFPASRKPQTLGESCPSASPGPPTFLSSTGHPGGCLGFFVGSAYFPGSTEFLPPD